MITIWQLNTVPHKFAIIDAGFRLWDFVAGAYEATANVPLDPEKHLKASEASIPFGLRTLAVPDAARPKELAGLAVVVYKQAGAGWSAVDAIPIDTLGDGGALANIYIGGR